MDATIVICTFNRSNLLDETLGQLRRLDLSGCGDWEILVVNNNCTDDTDTVIQRHCAHLPVRRLWEPRAGKSYAANLAVREAKADLILWTDDDVLVNRGWLRAYVEAARAHPHVSFFGGPIVPWFETKPPAWISRHLPLISDCFVAQAAFDEPFAPIAAPRLPYGANMGTRRRCFDDSGFEVNLGPVGRARKYQGEEVVLLQKILDRGLVGLWVRDAGVQHFISQARLTEGYVWRFHSCNGRTRVRLGEVAVGKKILGVPRWVLRQYLENLAICKLWSPWKNDRWIKSLTRAADCYGMISEIREQRRATRTDARQHLQYDGASPCK